MPHSHGGWMDHLSPMVTIRHFMFGKSICIGALNCQGLGGKYELPEFVDEVSLHEIFGVSETWLEGSKTSKINIPGYKFYPVRGLRGLRGLLNSLFIKYTYKLQKIINFRAGKHFTIDS